jgi:hypothetical protein
MRCFCNFLSFKNLIFCFGHPKFPNSSLRCSVFMNILASHAVFPDFLLAGLAFNLHGDGCKPSNRLTASRQTAAGAGSTEARPRDDDG